jgi:hypothetical protein
MGKHRHGSNSESGMRLLRRLEKNHDGLRSATTRQPREHTAAVWLERFGGRLQNPRRPPTSPYKSAVSSIRTRPAATG